MLSLLLFSAVGLCALPAGWHPVIVAGPFLGQNLEVLNDNKFTICNTGGKYEHLWINAAGPEDFYCISQGMKLGGWDNVNKVSQPKDGVKVRPFGYAGSTRNQIEGLSTFGAPEGTHPDYPIQTRLESLGFKLDESFFGHTYDWRLGVRDWELQYFPVFKQIIESASRQNNGSPVVLTGISMAGQYIHAFLSWARREVGPAWAAQYIHAIAPVATGWNGAVMGMSAVVDSILGTWRTDGLCPECEPVVPGNTRRRMGIPDSVNQWFQNEAAKIGDDLLRDMVASFPSAYLVHPGIDHSTNPPTDPEVLVIRNAQAPAECSRDPTTATVCGGTEDAGGYDFQPGFLAQDQCGECHWTYNLCEPGFDLAYDGWTQDLCCKRHQCTARTYRASELPQLYRDLGQETHAQMMEYSLTVDTTSDPGVPVHCIYSRNVQTFNQVNLALNKQSETQTVESNVITMGDGDQTCDHKSLEVCSRWPSTKKTYTISGVAHSSLMNVEQILDVLVGIATEDQATLDAWEEPRYSEVSPQALTVDPNVLLKRTVTAICDTPADVQQDVEFLDPQTQKMVKCKDADAYCIKNSCGDADDIREFFKTQTGCCSPDHLGTSTIPEPMKFNPTYWRLQKTEE